jgi:hypothetical protein
MHVLSTMLMVYFGLRHTEAFVMEGKFRIMPHAWYTRIVTIRAKTRSKDSGDSRMEATHKVGPFCSGGKVISKS